MSYTRKVVQISSKYKAGAEERWRNSIVGVAFCYANGEVSIVLDPGISIHSADNVKISIREPFDKTGRSQQQAPNQKQPARDTDDIPF